MEQEMGARTLEASESGGAGRAAVKVHSVYCAATVGKPPSVCGTHLLL